MAAVKAIPPQRKEPPLKKVAAYCRVSTKSQEQLDSLAAQERYYEEQIKANPNWKFAGIYADIGSGATIKGRKRFNVLLSAYYQRVCYGYKYDETGQLIIDKEKAEVVRTIFQMSDEGASLSQIAQELQERGVPSPRGKAVSRETLRKILHNEKYRGIVILQKTFVANCLNHKQITNFGQKEYYEIVDNHEAIIVKTI